MKIKVVDSKVVVTCPEPRIELTAAEAHRLAMELLVAVLKADHVA